MDKDKITSMISEIDYNDNNEIEHTEFIAATISDSVFQNEKVLEGLFFQFDLDNDGMINKEELV